MIKLSDRLQLIADKVEIGETMADIGTDHGFLPLYLIAQGISPKAIMCDISGPSLNKAREAAVEYGISKGALFREGDGLAVIEDGEVDTIVIAGMGGVLMTEIIGKDLKKSRSFKKFILQPRNNAGYLRKWLYDNGFEVSENLLVREGKFICEVIVVRCGKSPQIEDYGPEAPQWDLPPALTSREEGLVREFVDYKIFQENKKLKGLQKSKTIDEDEIAKAKSRMEYFRRYLDDQI